MDHFGMHLLQARVVYRYLAATLVWCLACFCPYILQKTLARAQLS